MSESVKMELGLGHLMIHVYLVVSALYDSGVLFSCSGSKEGGGSNFLGSFPSTTIKGCQ
jgi:hypothetical protein